MDKLPAFKLERFFSKWEFKAPHLLCCSDCEAVPMAELLALADTDAKARWESLSLSYTDTQGMPALREAVCKLYDALTPEELVVLAPEEGIYLCMLALLKPGDHVVVMYPGYQSLWAVAEAAGCEVTQWEPRLLPGGGVAFEPETLQALLRPGATKLVVTNFPHNPTGAAADAPLWEKLLAVCRAAGSPYVFSDEMYRFLERDPAASFPSLVDAYDKAIVLCGVSKSWGCPGLRIGWLASHDAGLLARVGELKDYTTICSSAPSEVLALMAVRATPTLTQRSRDIIAANLSHCEAFFAKWAHLFEWASPLAGPLCYPRLTTGEPIDAWCEKLVQEAGVLLLPASVYEHAPSTDAGHFRCGLGRRSLPECLAALDAWLVKTYGAPAPAGAAAAQWS